MSVKLLTGNHSEFLSLKGGCTGSSLSTLVKIPHCWKSRFVAQMACAPSLHSNQPVHPPSLVRVVSVFSGYQRILDIFRQTATTLIRQGRCTGRSKSSLHAYVIIDILTRYTVQFKCQRMRRKPYSAHRLQSPILVIDS